MAVNSHAEHVESEGKGIVTIAAGHGNYAALNNTQCSVKFLPTLFGVSVDATAATIAVTVLGPAEDMDPTAHQNATFESWNCNTLGDPSINETFTSDCGNYTARGQAGLGNIATRALRQLVDLSTLDNAFHISNLGEMFLSDIQNELQWSKSDSSDVVNSTDYNSTTLDQTNDHSTLTYSIEKALKSLLDDSLFAFASAQIILQKSTRSTPVTLTVGGIRFGTSGYIYGLFAFNSLLVIILLEELIRTHGWRGLPKFDYDELKNMAANSKEGPGISKKATVTHQKHNSVRRSDSSYDAISEIPVQPDSDGHDEKSMNDNTSMPQQGLWTATPYVRVHSSDNVSL